MDAPILAHAGSSNEAGPGYGSRADHYYWTLALRNTPGLRVCLAHYGSFDTVSVGAAPGEKLPEASWEWTSGRYIAEAAGNGLYLDLSYFTEALASPGKRTKTADFVKQWMQFDKEARHLMFGTDWVMLAPSKAQNATPTRLHLS